MIDDPVQATDVADSGSEPLERSRLLSLLGVTSISTLIPGLGLFLAGRRRLGLVVLSLVLGGLAVLGLYFLNLSTDELVSLAVSPRALLGATILLAAAAVAMIINGVVSYRVLRPSGLGGWQRVTVLLTTSALVAVTAVPLLTGSYYAWIQRDLLTTVFNEEPVSYTEAAGAPIPDRSATRAAPSDPWADTPRLNVLLLGSDSGPGREGARTDTVVLASIDTASGDTTLFSLPRNLEQVPFPDDHVLHDYYPWGFTGDGGVGSNLLNAVYSTVPAYYPAVFEEAVDPGAEAMKLAVEGALGLPVDYYVMVNMQGFQRLVDSLGGVDINVRYTIPMENKVLSSGVCSEPTGYIYPGEQRLNGWEAMWYARARCGGEGVADDYDRMRRQRCVIGAMIERSDPLNLLRQFDGLAEATKNMVSSDIPQDELAAFVTLGLRVKDAQVRSLPFTNQVINPGYPDYAGIQAQVQEALEPPAKKSNGKGSKGGATADDAPTATEPTEQQGVLALDEVC